MSARIDGAAVGSSRLATELPQPAELAALEPVRVADDAATVRLEPLGAPPARPVALLLRCARPIDARAGVLFESLGARAGELVRSTHTERLPHPGVLRTAAQAVVEMVATLRGLEGLERAAELGRKRGAVRA